MTGFIDPLESSPDLPAAPDPTERDLVRELVLRAHPEVVPELVRGETIAELIASIEPARQAYTDLVARIAPEARRPHRPSPLADHLRSCSTRPGFRPAKSCASACRTAAATPGPRTQDIEPRS